MSLTVINSVISLFSHTAGFFAHNSHCVWYCIWSVLVLNPMNPDAVRRETLHGVHRTRSGSATPRAEACSSPSQPNGRRGTSRTFRGQPSGGGTPRAVRGSSPRVRGDRPGPRSTTRDGCLVRVQVARFEQERRHHREEGTSPRPPAGSNPAR